MTGTTWTEWTAEQLRQIRSFGRWRELRSFDARGPSGLLDGRAVTSFASNDYLGLTDHPAVIAAACQATDRWGTGAGASRLVVGSRPVHHELEAELADWKGTARSLLFPTGYAANVGVLATLASPDVTVFSDESNHASIIDGCRLGRGRVIVYRHNDMDHLTELLSGVRGRTLVVTDTVFSMDGDAVDLSALTRLCARRGALLVLDEAHAVFGPDLPGGIDGLDVLRVGTLSKMLGSLGGFVAGPAGLIELLINRARPFIFTTAPAPSAAAAALAALRIMGGAEGDVRRAILRRHLDRLRPGHPSPIVPVILGEEKVATAVSAALLQRGILVPAIRPPTVAPGTSRLRVALSAGHTDAMVDQLLDALNDIPAMVRNQ